MCLVGYIFVVVQLKSTFIASMTSIGFWLDHLVGIGEFGIVAKMTKIFANTIKCHDMVRAKITNVHVGKQPMMVQNDHVVNCIYFFPPINPCAMCFILLGLVNFNQSAINKPNRP